MSEIDRRSVEELVTRYEFHPEFRDIYVEGPRDASLFGWFIAECEGSTAKVYLIDQIDISSEAVQSYSVNHTGSAGRLVALAVMLDQRLAPICDSIRCLIDRDQHDFGYPAPSTRYLRLFDVGSLEGYALRERPFRKFCDITLGKHVSVEVFEALKEVLHVIFAIRLAKRIIAPNARLFGEFTKFCVLNGQLPQIDVDGFVRRVAAVSGGQLPEQTLREALNAGLDAAKRADLRAIHGHDFVTLMVWYAKKMNVPRDLANELSLQRSILSAIELFDLRSESLCAELAAWAGARNDRPVGA